MKELPVYQDAIKRSSEAAVFKYLIETLNDSITYWDYFVNWEKVNANIRDLEIDLNTLNYLVGKTDIEQEFKSLITKHNSIARLIPILLACRDREFKILTDYTSGSLQYETFSFASKHVLSKEDIDSVCRFAKETGLLDLFLNKKLKSVPDYVLGVEVGLDSNGRKNRSGTSMEGIIEKLLQPICQQHQFSLMKQATSEKIHSQWGITLQVDKSSRRFDFAIKRNETLFLIETNYYSGGGSKLKSTAGEYKSLHDFLTQQKHNFIWITDGQGWRSTVRPLEETFNHIDYLLNLNMIFVGILEYMLVNEG